MHLPLHNRPTKTRSTDTHFDVLDHGEPESEVEIFDIFPSLGSTTYRGPAYRPWAEPQPRYTWAVAHLALCTAANTRSCGSLILARSVLTDFQTKNTVAVAHLLPLAVAQPRQNRSGNLVQFRPSQTSEPPPHKSRAEAQSTILPVNEPPPQF